MSKRQRRITRREFGTTLAAAGVFAAAPAILRGRNLNDKLNIAFIACGGRANASLGELTITPGRPPEPTADAPAVPHPDENVVVICDVNQNAIDAASQRFPQAKKFHDFRKIFDKPERLRRRRRLDRRAHARVRDLPGADARQARLLREAAHLQHLGSAAHSRARREVPEAVDADGQPGARVADAPQDQGDPGYRRHRSGARSARVGRARVGTPGRRVGREVRQAARVLQRRPDRRSVQGRNADPGTPPLGSVARTRAGAAVPRDLLSRDLAGIAGGMSATAR